MATHHVSFTIPERDLGKADIEFAVYRDGAKFGTLKVSKGAVVWVVKDHTYGFHLSWKDFDKVMRENGKKGA
jgi:hypothetical protein